MQYINIITIFTKSKSTKLESIYVLVYYNTIICIIKISLNCAFCGIYTYVPYNEHAAICYL